jgi:uncharacterized protein (DUF305 family)
MKRALAQMTAAGLLVMVASACSSMPPAQGPVQGWFSSVKGAPGSRVYQPNAELRAAGITQPWSDADIEFMGGMVPHHAQALIMAAWAETHGARSDVSILCGRILVGQRDEIDLMRTWLMDRGLPAPDARSTRHKMIMNGMEHEMLMPGMLTDAEMAALDKARGPEWDRLFLIGMIKHHQGAIDMVEKLLKSYGAAQDDTVFKFANDVHADQSIEIDVMKEMLAAGGGGH